MLHDTYKGRKLSINKVPKATTSFSLPRYFFLHLQWFLYESDGCNCIKHGFLGHEKLNRYSSLSPFFKYLSLERWKTESHRVQRSKYIPDNSKKTV